MFDNTILKRILPQEEKNDQNPINPFIHLTPVRTSAQRMEDARNQPNIKQLCSMIWQTNELHLLFADTGIGKSILAVAISDAISKGNKTMFLENENAPLTVLYYDFELSDRQFTKRYSNESGEEHFFNDNFFIDNIDFVALTNISPQAKFNDLLFQKINYDIQQTSSKVLIIDNLTFLNTQSTQDTQIALEVMRKLNEMKKEFDLSILVLAHTPKRDLSSPITINHLAGSKHLSNFADSISAIGKSVQGSNVRYWKQIKPSRSGEMLYDTDNVITCEIVKDDTILTFEFIGYSSEYGHLIINKENQTDEKKSIAKQLHAQGKSLREIAQELSIGKSSVQRWLNEPDKDVPF
jgi:archaellum biogenesis ATPase FlaH